MSRRFFSRLVSFLAPASARVAAASDQRTSRRRLRFENLERRELLAVLFDSDFGEGGKTLTNFPGRTDASATDMIVQKNGKILVAGLAQNGNTATLAAIARYQPDGYLDPTFGMGGKVTVDMDFNVNIAVQEDGKIILVGTDDGPVSGNRDFKIVRLNRDGSADATFGSGGSTFVHFSDGDYPESVAVAPNGKIVVFGSAYTGSNSDFVLCRLNSNGTLDTNFGGTGQVTTDLNFDDFASAMRILPNGKVLVTGGTRAGVMRMAVLRYNTNGTLDNTFSNDGLMLADVGTMGSFPRNLTIQENGAIVVVGNHSVSTLIGNIAVVRLRGNGTLDPTFSDDGKVSVNFGAELSEGGFDIAVQANDKIVVAGFVNGSDDILQGALVRLNPNGRLDKTFDSDGKRNVPLGSDGTFTNMELLADGKILAVGRAKFGTSQSFVLARFLETKPVITSFIVPNRAKVHERVHLSTYATDRNQTSASLSYTWTITGPQNLRLVLRGRNVSFVPATKGEYAVSLLVRDDEGLIARESDRVTVS